MRKIFIIPVLTFMIAVGVGGTVSAAKPTFHEKINETIPDLEVCGVVGTLHITGTQTITIDDTTFRSTGQVRQVFTADGGRTVVIASAGTYTGTLTDNGDGTVTYSDTYKGLPEKISSRGPGGVSLRDAGLISFIFTFNEETGEETFELVQHGPHPEADSDFTLFCDAFLDALG